MKLTRRNFLMFIGTASSSLKLLAQSTPQFTDDATAEESVNPCSIAEEKSPQRWASEDIRFFVDGPIFTQSQQNTRATLAVLIKLIQSEDKYIDKVMLLDSEDQWLAVRYPDLRQKMPNGFAPYFIFDNIDVTKNNPCKLIFQVKEKGIRTVYRHVFPLFARSKMNGLDLPTEINLDLRESHGSFISGIYTFSDKISVETFSKHIIRAKVLSLPGDGSFKISIDFMQDDQDRFQYNRYFIITDPVGRMLGIKKREFNDGIRGSVEVTELKDPVDTDRWRVTKDQVADIRSCPYVMIFVDDVKETLMKRTLYLR